MIFLLLLNLASAQNFVVSGPMTVSVVDNYYSVKGLTNLLIEDKVKCKPDITSKGVKIYAVLRVQDMDTKKKYYVCLDKGRVHEKKN